MHYTEEDRREWTEERGHMPHAATKRRRRRRGEEPAIQDRAATHTPPPCLVPYTLIQA